MRFDLKFLIVFFEKARFEMFEMAHSPRALKSFLRDRTAGLSEGNAKEKPLQQIPLISSPPPHGHHVSHRSRQALVSAWGADSAMKLSPHTKNDTRQHNPSRHLRLFMKKLQSIDEAGKCRSVVGTSTLHSALCTVCRPHYSLTPPHFFSLSLSLPQQNLLPVYFSLNI